MITNLTVNPQRLLQLLNEESQFLEEAIELSGQIRDFLRQQQLLGQANRDDDPQDQSSEASIDFRELHARLAIKTRDLASIRQRLIAALPGSDGDTSSTLSEPVLMVQLAKEFEEPVASKLVESWRSLRLRRREFDALNSANHAVIQYSMDFCRRVLTSSGAIVEESRYDASGQTSKTTGADAKFFKQDC
ncbi:MAG: hypothetical protein AAFN77_08695 [Planctomycetota bacterium]